jgi:hypothetical protein
LILADPAALRGLAEAREAEQAEEEAGRSAPVGSHGPPSTRVASSKTVAISLA